MNVFQNIFTDFFCQQFYNFNFPKEMRILNNFIRQFYWILRFLADYYFFSVNLAFSFWNGLKRRKQVQWARGDESQKLLLISATKAAKMIREGKLSSRTLVDAYISRIKFVQPLLNGMNRDNFELAVEMAEQTDAQLANMSQKERLASTKPLFGVPFTSKSNIKAKGLVIDACNRKLMKAGIVCQEDAPIVKRIKDSGAILLCLTTMPNLGLSYACDDSGCGMTNNPHDSRRIPGGSSSGEGALVSSAASPFGIGNDIGGSIRIPAHMCGIFGLKPTNFPEHTVPLDGLVPKYQDYGPADQMLSNGPLARYAEDLPLILSIMANKPLDFYEQKLEFNGVDIRLFYFEDVNILISEKLHLEQRNVLRKVKNYFERKFNLNVQKVEFPLMSRLFELWGLDGWTEGVVNPIKLLGQFFEIQSGYSDHTFFQWNFDLLKNFVHPKSEEERGFVAEKLAKLRQQFEECLGQNGVLLMPAWPTPAPFHHMEPFVTFNTKYTQMFNMLGSPALSVPIGRSSATNMPLGIQLAAAPFNEAILISVAKELEKAFGGWVPPGKMPKELMEAMDLHF